MRCHNYLLVGPWSLLETLQGINFHQLCEGEFEMFTFDNGRIKLEIPSNLRNHVLYAAQSFFRVVHVFQQLGIWSDRGSLVLRSMDICGFVMGPIPRGILREKIRWNAQIIDFGKNEGKRRSFMRLFKYRNIIKWWLVSALFCVRVPPSYFCLCPSEG